MAVAESTGFKIEAGVPADLFQQIGAAGGGRQRRQAELGEQLADFGGEFVEEAHDVLGLAAELGAQFGTLRGDAGGTGVEVALARHVAAERDQDGGAEGEFVGAEQRGDDDVARGAQAAVGAQTDAAAQAVVDEDLLRFGEAQFPGIAGVLDAGERRGAGAAGVAGDHDVVGIGLGDACGDGAHAAAGDQLDADGGARVDALQIPDELGQIFDGVDVVVRRRRDELHAGLRVAQARNEFRDLVAGKLAAFAGLGALGDLDFELFGVNQVFRGNAEARAGDLLDLVVQQRRRAVDRRIHGRIFAAFAGVGARAEQVHGLGNGLVRFGRERSERHGAGDKAMGDGLRRLDLVERKFRTGGANLEQVAEVRGRGIDGLRGEAGKGSESQGGSLLGGTDNGLQRAHDLRLPAVRLGLVGLAETHETIVGKIAHLGGGDNGAVAFRGLIGSGVGSSRAGARGRRSARNRDRRWARERRGSTCRRRPAKGRWRRRDARRDSCRRR